MPAQNGLGKILVSLGRTAEGIEHFRQAVAIDPVFAEARANLEAAQRASGTR